MFQWLRPIAAVLLLLVSLLVPGLALAASTCTVTAFQIDGTKYVYAAIVETGARDTTEVACSGVPPVGTILAQRATLTAGTGTTLHPVVGSSAAFTTSSQSHIITATATAAHINEQGRASYYSPTGVLYVRHAPNSSATDHAVSGNLIIAAGAL